jgi:hypothetical protein
MDTVILLDAAMDDLLAAGLDPRKPIVAGAFAGALAGQLGRGMSKRSLVDLLAEAVSLTVTTLHREPDTTGDKDDGD